MRKTYGPLKAKQCKLGVNCGGSCINKNKRCNIDLDAKQKLKVAEAAKTLKNPKVAEAAKTLKDSAAQISPKVIAESKAASKAEAKSAATQATAAKKEPDKYAPKPSPSANKEVTTRAYLQKTQSLFNDKELTIENPKQIGAGAYGIVSSNNNLAIKQIRDGKLARISREVEMQQVAAGLGIAPKVVSYSKKQIVMTLAPGVTVAVAKFNSGKNFMTSEDWADYHASKGAALLSLHKVGISHNDAHMENIFYDKSTKKVTFIDFGLASRNVPSDLFQEYKQALSANISMNYNRTFNTADEYMQWLKD